MPWEQVSPGRFERPLDDIEIFFKTIADQGAAFNREHWAVSVYAKFRDTRSSIDTGLALRNTWKTMRYDHPEIASFIDGGKKVYETPDSIALSRWMTQTFHEDFSSNVDSLFAQSRPSQLPTLHYLPQKSSILIRSSHWRIDGIGALHLLNNFFRAFAELRCVEYGNEWKNLSPGLSEAAKLSQSPTKESADAAARLMREYTSNMPSIGLPSALEKQTPGDTRLIKLDLPRATTIAIVSACKSRGYSVTTALHAALVNATQQQAPKDDPSKSYTSWISYNLRPYVQPCYNDSGHAVSVYLVGFPITLTPSDFSRNTVQLKNIYAQLSSPQTSFNFATCLIPYIREATTLFSHPPSEDTAAPTEPMLDSIGVADRYLQPKHGNSIEITDFWLASETLSRQLTVYVWTWRGRMTLCTCFNEDFYKAEYVKKFVEQIKEILLSELAIR